MRARQALGCLEVAAIEHDAAGVRIPEEAHVGVGEIRARAARTRAAGRPAPRASHAPQQQRGHDRRLMNRGDKAGARGRSGPVPAATSSRSGATGPPALDGDGGGRRRPRGDRWAGASTRTRRAARRQRKRAAALAPRLGDQRDIGREGRKRARSVTCTCTPSQRRPRHLWKAGSNAVARKRTPGSPRRSSARGEPRAVEIGRAHQLEGPRGAAPLGEVGALDEATARVDARGVERRHIGRRRHPRQPRVLPQHAPTPALHGHHGEIAAERRACRSDSRPARAMVMPWRVGSG